jgi:hypothetical protein
MLEQRGLDIRPVHDAHVRELDALRTVRDAVPTSWRRTEVLRPDLDRFLFEPEDVIVAVGQDGLVPNVARYVDGRPVLGVNPDPDAVDGVLVRHAPEHVAAILRSLDHATVETRTMLRATTSDGHELLALNELFVGHRSHQSARYCLSWHGRTERHSSSGVVITTGTGATGWAKSIRRCHRSDLKLPTPEERALAFFVREAWPSGTTGTELTEGRVADDDLEIRSEMGEGGVAFGDGMEGDALPLPFSTTIRVGCAATVLRLVVP